MLPLVLHGSVGVSKPERRMNLFSSWLVHLYTASGALAAFFGTLAVFDGHYREALLWMVAATVVDATDGLLARKARVKERLPAFDGARLDDIVDYLTFVFLPVLLPVQVRSAARRMGRRDRVGRAPQQRLWVRGRRRQDE